MLKIDVSYKNFCMYCEAFSGHCSFNVHDRLPRVHHVYHFEHDKIICHKATFFFLLILYLSICYTQRGRSL